MNKELVTIIGGGPAGLMTAIQLKRYGIASTLIERNQLGGLLWNANLVENYPGFPNGIPGPNLVSLFEKQFHNLDLTHKQEEVVFIDYQDSEFLIKTNKTKYFSKILIVASGTKPNTFPEKSVPETAKNKIFYEVKPLLEMERKEISIIGAGDAAFDYALNLAKGKNKISILNRSEKIKALPLLVSRIQKFENIRYLPNQKLESIKLVNGKLQLKTLGKDNREFDVDFLIGALGRQENRVPISEKLKSNQNLLVKNKRLYYIGDVSNGIYRQTGIAVGDGLKAAMGVYQFLKE